MKTLLLIITYFYLSLTFASSCCGSSGGGSNVIISDNRDEFSYGISKRNDFGHTTTQSDVVLNGEAVKDSQFIHQLSYTRQMSDFVQVSASSQIIEKEITKANKKNQKTGFSSLDLQSSYEFLPEFTYSLYKPRAFIFLKYSFPLSKTIYNSYENFQVDVFGEGFHSISSGIIAFKKWDRLSLRLGGEYKYLFSQKFDFLVVKNFYKVSVPFSLATNFSDFTLGISNNFNYTSPKKIEGSRKSISSSEHFWLSSLFLNYNYSRELSFGLNYSDSSIVGASKNSPLFNSITFNFIKAQEI